MVIHHEEAASSGVQPPERVLCNAKYREIDGDPHNVRQTLKNIPALAESIHQWGLLENLVGVEIPEYERESPERWIQLRAGSRRIAAIGLLIEQGRWDPERLIPVVMIEGSGFWENLVENIQREGLDPWDVGRRLSEAAAGGLNHRDIGYRIGRSNGWVGRHIQIGTGLSPQTIAYIQEHKLEVKIGELFRLSFIKDKYGDPDGDKQIEALQKQRRRKPPKRRTPDSLRAFSNRINYLKSQMPVPPLLRPVVSAVLEYLEGGGRPNFKGLTRQMQGENIRLREDADYS